MLEVKVQQSKQNLEEVYYLDLAYIYIYTNLRFAVLPYILHPLTLLSKIYTTTTTLPPLGKIEGEKNINITQFKICRNPKRG